MHILTIKTHAIWYSPLVDFFRRLVQDNLLGELNDEYLEPEYAAKCIVDGIERGNIFGVILLDSRESIQGVYIAREARRWFSPERMMQEMILYITPEYRKGTNFLRMYNRMEKQCRERNLSKMQIGDGLQVNSEKYYKLLKRYGFKQRVYFTKEIKHE